ncbi:MAG: hypothetical protein ACRDSG_19700 [Pseudonocardiaceae bacterium]
MLLPDVVLERIQRDRAEHRVEQLSQFIADVLCLIYGRKDLVWELNPQDQLEFPVLDFHEPEEAPSPGRPAAAGTSRVKIRVPEEVMTRVKEDRERFKISSWAVFISDLLCHAYESPDLARELNRGKEQLALPIAARAQLQEAVA